MQNSKLRQAITNTIVQSLLDGGLPPWRQPWRCSRNAGSPVNVVSKRPYSGVNPLLLAISAQRHNFQSRSWATFAQWKQLRGSVMRRPADVAPGQWGTTIVFCRPVTKTETDPDGEETETMKGMILRSYTVFNIDQVEGEHLDHLRAGMDTLEDSEVEERFEEVERIVAATNADIRFGSDRAYYSVTGDYIAMPHRSQFTLPEFQETLFHELVHWTEASHRLNWDRKLPANTYACGELIAELGGCFLASEVGLPVAENMINHLAYLQNWIETMQTDPKFIFKVASQASRAVDFILSFSRSPEESEQPAEELVMV